MTAKVETNLTPLQRYYRFHSYIYDATRWSFLFGRKRIIKIAAKHIDPQNILEVGCGTGMNLVGLAQQFPDAKLTGVDLSGDMLSIAERKTENNRERIKLLNKNYDTPITDLNGNTLKYDLILFSYALSMFNPGWDQAIKTAKQQLSEDGVIAIVDFHHSEFKWFRQWMQVNHVKMQAHLLPMLDSMFTAKHSEQHNAYAGVWQYMMFIGKKT